MAHSIIISPYHLHSLLGVKIFIPGLPLPRFILSPIGIYYRLWTYFFAIVVIYSAWIFPFEVSFLDKKGALTAIDIIVIIFSFLNIGISLNVGYLDPSSNVLISDRMSIARRYSLWLITDLIFAIFGILRLSKNNVLIYLVYGILNIVELHTKVISILTRREKNIKYSYFLLRFTKLIGVTLFLIHYMACLFYVIAVHYNNPLHSWLGKAMDILTREDLWTRYMTCTYLSVTTVGFGDLHPTNRLEMLFTSGYMLFNVVFVAYLVGNMAELFLHKSSQTRKFRESVEAVSVFSRSKQLSLPLQERMYTELCLDFIHNEEVFHSLPRATRSMILCRDYTTIMEEVYLFRTITLGSVHDFVSRMKMEFFSSYKDVFASGQASTELYLVVQGEVELRYDTGRIQRVQVGQIFGEIGFICNKPHQMAARTNQVSLLLRINRQDFMDIVHNNIALGTTIIQNFLKKYNDLSMQVEKMLSRGWIDILVSPCYAAERGNIVMLKHMLDKGLDPDESFGGNIALCLSASKGDTQAVVLLLEYGADPNICDSEGNVPLWQAMKGGHRKVKNILLKKNGDLKKGDSGLYACIAIMQVDVKLLDEIKKHGGEIKSTCRHHHGDILWGTKPADLANKQGNQEVIKYFEDAEFEDAEFEDANEDAEFEDAKEDAEFEDANVY